MWILLSHKLLSQLRTWVQDFAGASPQTFAGESSVELCRHEKRAAGKYFNEINVPVREGINIRSHSVDYSLSHSRLRAGSDCDPILPLLMVKLRASPRSSTTCSLSSAARFLVRYDKKHILLLTRMITYLQFNTCSTALVLPSVRFPSIRIPMYTMLFEI
ncbi:hypothetical protein MPTK1_3g05070 [Marchantia polymorpha subsp. ruderalis]|uniref:Uncharacterized protein n=2 Tax=Marchantia polymorpha TaxID=3197 RepID=A0AAF6AXK3_MARPO|nr:hypothetical protein MARPO_0022s0021 [Marchantia polymorpha]BBN04487.1 hypothetical protein Mp_3g05070 [Marchantia polymorpha subsp. ruderalis]|eukprot:PTQ43913.1 hypothetical protein MARPO_0022s0021 [Marchantia polymorpha]